MTLDEKCTLSYFVPVASISEEHHVDLVQHSETGQIFVKKIISAYNFPVVETLLNHPVRNMPTIHNVFQDEENVIVIEDYIPGETLEQKLSQHGPFSENEVANWMHQLCTIIGELQSLNPPIIHRDIKPSNIIITPDNILKLLDISAAREFCNSKSQDTILIGTAGYAAPEQYGFSESSLTTDMYSIGVLMNKLLTGKFPNECKYTGTLSEIISKCIQLNPADRYVSIFQLDQAIMTVQNPKKSRANVDGFRRFLPPGYRSKNALIHFLSTAGYALLISAVATYIPKNPTPYNIAINRIFLSLTFIVIVAISGNYLDCLRFLPIAKSNNKKIRFLGILLWDFFALIFLLGILGFIEK